MPEMKRNFTKGKMNKDLDERLVPPGEYRDAMNIQVSTSEGSDVGTIQNVLGNTPGCVYNDPMLPNPIQPGSSTVASVADEKNDSLYWLVAGNQDIQSQLPLIPNQTITLKDMIMRTGPLNQTFDTGCEPVFVDKWGFCVGINMPGSVNQNSVVLDNSDWYDSITVGMNITGFNGITPQTSPGTVVTQVGPLYAIEPVSYSQGFTSTSVIQPTSTHTVNQRLFDNFGCSGANNVMHVYDHVTPCPGYNNWQSNLPPNGHSQIYMSNPPPNGIVVGATISNSTHYNNGAQITSVYSGSICTQPNGGCSLLTIVTIDQLPIISPTPPPFNNEAGFGQTPFNIDVTPPAVVTNTPNNTIYLQPISHQWLNEIFETLWDDPDGVWNSGDEALSGGFLQIDNYYGAGSSWPANACIDPNSVVDDGSFNPNANPPVYDYIFNIIDCNSGSPINAFDLNPNSKPLRFTTLNQFAPEAVFLNNNIDLSNSDSVCFTSERALEFDRDNLITGINIIDDMLFWTDNFTEPKKINIPRSIEGTDFSGDIHTKIINTATGVNFMPAKQEHITVIRQAPKNALQMDLKSFREDGVNYSGLITISDINNTSLSTLWDQFNNNSGASAPYDFSSLTTNEGSNIFRVVIPTDLAGNSTFELQDWKVGAKVVLKEFDADGTPPSIPISDYTIKGTIIAWDYTDANGDLIDANNFSSSNGNVKVMIKADSISRVPETPIAATSMNYGIDLFDESERLFEFKLPRFSYRYKYEDGEYSTFAPWTSVAFLPGSFDYHPKKGYNLGMTNNLSHLFLRGFTTNVPIDVVEIDILYKEEISPNVYVVETLRSDLELTVTDVNGIKSNNWILNEFRIDEENIKSVLPSNQILRPWDNVPKKALAQDVTGNRIIYGNYEQNYDLTLDGNEFSPMFSRELVNDTSNVKSIKSLREYQLGVVFTDKYGRETPVLSNSTAIIKIGKDGSNNYNKLKVGLNNSAIPVDMEYFKFYIKETSGEYYNMAMDRYWDAEDGNVWISFASTDRNKIDIDSFLILKKGVESNKLVEDTGRFKVVAIENEAPDFIKINKRVVSDIKHNTGAFNTNVFLTGSDLPEMDNREFSLAYFDGANNAHIYSNTAIKNIHKEKDINEEYYFQILSEDGSVGSTPMKIAKIDVEDDDWINAITLVRWKITLEKPFDATINQFTNDVTGSNSTLIKNNNRAVIWSYKKENSAEFDGRFFVKIFNDDVFTKYVINSSTGETTNFTNARTQKIYSFEPNKHTKAFNNASGAIPPSSPTNYLVSKNNNGNTPVWNHYVDATNAVALGAGNGGATLPWKEHVAFFRGINVFKMIPSSTLHQVGWDNHGIGKVKPFGSMDLHGSPDEWTFEDVWFVDSRNSAGQFTGAWGASNPTSNTHVPAGIDTTNNFIELGFGGLQPIEITGGSQYTPWAFDGQFTTLDQDFYDITQNGNYSSDAGQFASLLTTQTAFRWVDDPSGQIYRVVNASQENLVRHEHGQGPLAVQYASARKTAQAAPGTTINDVQYCTSTFFRPSNFTKNFKLTIEDYFDPAQVIGWNPFTTGAIVGGLHLQPQVDGTGMAAGGNSVTMANASNITNVADANGLGNFGIQVGMVWETGTGTNAVISKIDGLTLYFKNYDPTAPNGTFPAISGSATINIKQYGFNGISRNSAKNINYFNDGKGFNDTNVGVDAVGYEIEILEPSVAEALFPRFPAIFETEPKETKDLDIYYEITDNIPTNLNSDTISSILPIGAVISVEAADSLVGENGFMENAASILAYTPSGSGVILSAYFGPINIVGGDKLIITKPNGDVISIEILSMTNTGVSPLRTIFELKSSLITQKLKSSWHNCYSFGNGVESNRIRDNFNLTYISNGVKASTTLSENYKLERRKHGLIYSGLYNSTSGLNNLNQFVQAEKITKDINPIYGSIQKLKAGWGVSGDLVTLCEDRVLKILANKDALFNADGNANVTATDKVLGQAVPYSGEFGISTNPESFASESYRAYFTDKVRGTVMRLSTDGLTPISDHGMKDWFRDNLKLHNRLVGSYDDKKDEYNITLIDYTSQGIENGVPLPPTNDIGYTVTFKENVKGWVSFKSFITENSSSCANEYYTFKNGDLWKHHHDVPGNRNTFYNIPTSSSFNVILNDAPGIVKSFHTLNYEGSDSKVTLNTTDNEYYNLGNKPGWYVDSIFTNKEKGEVQEFIEKEGKWFYYLKGRDIAYDSNSNIAQDPDGFYTWEQGGFAIQGLGAMNGAPSPASILGCTDSTAGNYDPTANIDDGSCTYPDPVPGCTYSTANNYDCATAINQGSMIPCTDGVNTDDGSCVWLGCDDPSATNYAINWGGQFPVEAQTYTGIGIQNDGSCIATVFGCTDPTAFNYNPAANTNDPQNPCVPVVNGCMGQNDTFGTFIPAVNAINYNSLANTDDGTCQWDFCANALDANFNQDMIDESINYITAGIGYINAYDCISGGCYADASAPNYLCFPGNTAYPCNDAVLYDDGSCITASFNCSGSPNYNCTDPGDGSGTYSTLQDCQNNCTNVVLGCTDPTAFNYDPLANTNDGSCITSCLPYTIDGYGMVPTSSNGASDGELQLCFTAPAGWDEAELSNSWQWNFVDVQGNAVPYTPSSGPASWISTGCLEFPGFSAGYYMLTFADAYGCPIVDPNLVFNIVDPGILGCTDPNNPVNYNSLATVDDGTCSECTVDPTGANPWNINAASLLYYSQSPYTYTVEHPANSGIYYQNYYAAALSLMQDIQLAPGTYGSMWLPCATASTTCTLTAQNDQGAFSNILALTYSAGDIVQATNGFYYVHNGAANPNNAAFEPGDPSMNDYAGSPWELCAPCNNCP